MSEHFTHHQNPEHPPSGGRTEARIAARIEDAALNGRDIDTETARRIARALSRTAEADSALASFAATGEEGTYEQLRDEYLAIYNAENTPPELREWIDWLGTYLVRRENDSWIASRCRTRSRTSPWSQRQRFATSTSSSGCPAPQAAPISLPPSSCFTTFRSTRATCSRRT